MKQPDMLLRDWIIKLVVRSTFRRYPKVRMLFRN
jgi:hypothetical protein